jgi:DNA-binding MarR family transcriptional regulator/GNAT superfamily N-acetyltransferase
MGSEDDELSARVAVLRAFNRFWTGEIHVLDGGLLETPYSLTEARIIFELAQQDCLDMIELRVRLGIDPAYLSRIVGRFRADGLVEADTSIRDGRRKVLRLTESGREVFAMLDRRSIEENGALLTRLSAENQSRLMGAIETIRDVVENAPLPAAYRIRGLQPGDLGWVVQRHGVIYSEEYGWDETFEALVARIVADYVEERDQLRHNAWIAELEGEPVGCVFCVGKDLDTAQLRILLVEPKTRGLGIGTRLVDECIRFAGAVGYRGIVLWTNDVLVAARRIYESAGFRLIQEEPHHSFGHDLIGQTFELPLISNTARAGGRGAHGGQPGA